MNDQELQLQRAKELSSQLEKIDQQLSKISGKQQSLTDKGDEYLKKLEGRCSQLENLRTQLENLKDRIDWTAWRYDNRLRVTALIVIGLLLVFSIVLLCFKLPVWKPSSDAKVSSKAVVGSVSSLKRSTPLISFASPEICNDVMLCDFQENNPPDASPPAENQDTARSEKAAESANDTQSAFPQEQISDPIREDRVDHGRERRATESGNELSQRFDLAIELKESRLAPDTENENPAPFERTPMNDHEAKVWSFAILALTVAILFGFAAFATAKIVRDE